MPRKQAGGLFMEYRAAREVSSLNSRAVRAGALAKGLRLFRVSHPKTLCCKTACCSMVPMSTTTKKPSQTVVNKFLAALQVQRAAYCDLAAIEAEGFTPGAQPEIRMDWDWLGYGGHPSIVWEEGPYEWAYLFPFGGVDEEFGFKVKDVSAMLPEGWYAEAITSWSIGIYES